MKKVIISIAVLAIFAISFMIKDRKIRKSDEYSITSNTLSNVESDIFVNTKTRDGKPTKELIIYLKKLKNPKFIIVAIPPKLIGIPEDVNSFTVTESSLSFKEESKVMFPLNEGPDSEITDFFISDDTISFNTFGDLKRYGEKIVIRKSN